MEMNPGPKTKVATQQQDKVATKAKAKFKSKCIKKIKIQNIPNRRQEKNIRPTEAMNGQEVNGEQRLKYETGEITRGRHRGEKMLTIMTTCAEGRTQETLKGHKRAWKIKT